ncbi:alpha/beta fold hydrolase [Streptacidiphilus monticola]
MAPLLAAGYRVLVPDLRGYGGSSRPEDPAAYDIVSLTGDLVGLLDAEGPRTPSSWGTTGARPWSGIWLCCTPSGCGRWPVSASRRRRTRRWRPCRCSGPGWATTSTSAGSSRSAWQTRRSEPTCGAPCSRANSTRLPGRHAASRPTRCRAGSPSANSRSTSTSSRPTGSPAGSTTTATSTATGS